MGSDERRDAEDLETRQQSSGSPLNNAARKVGAIRVAVGALCSRLRSEGNQKSDQPLTGHGRLANGGKARVAQPLPPVQPPLSATMADGAAASDEGGSWRLWVSDITPFYKTECNMSSLRS